MSSTLVDQAKTANESENYEKAVQLLDKVIQDNNKHFGAYLERAVSHQKLKEHNKAIYLDAYNALLIAKERHKRTDIALAYFRIAVNFFLLKNYYSAFKYLKYAEKYGIENSALLGVWYAKVSKKLKIDDAALWDFLSSLNLDDSTAETELMAEKKVIFGEQKAAVNEAVSDKKTQPAVLPKALPVTPKPAVSVSYPPQDQVKKEFYENATTVTVSVYIKHVPKDSFKVFFAENSIEFEFKTESGSDYIYSLDNLSGQIDPQASSYTVFGTKVELVLAKKTSGLWKSLQTEPAVDESIEGNGTTQTFENNHALQYPSSSKKQIDWTKLDVEYGNEEDEEGDEMKLFSSIYKNADPDTRKAMMKSYTESGGTALSTNWAEVSQKKYEIDPPDGMVAKKWDE